MSNNQNGNKDQTRRGGNKNEKLSRALSWALRHHGPAIGLSMTPDGYVPVSQILSSKHPKLKSSPSWTIEDMEQIVKSSDKQRFQLDQRPAKSYPGVTVVEDEVDNTQDTTATTILCIRATQGHSLKFIDADLLLTPIPPAELAQIHTIVHGTYLQPWQNAISKQGLHRMNRNHIHFAPGLARQQAGGVISGMRKTCCIYIYLDATKCAAASPDLCFYRSANGVLLTAGIRGEGTLPVEYFSHVTNSDGTLLLDKRTTATITS